MNAIKTTIKIILLFLVGLFVGSLCAGSFTASAQDKTKENKPTNTFLYSYTDKAWKGYRSYKVSFYNDKQQLIRQINDCRMVRIQGDFV